MTWNYSGNPSDSSLMECRFLVGDITLSDPLCQDEEILYAIAKYSTNLRLASALILRTLAAKFAVDVDGRAGDISASKSQRAKAFLELANMYDPNGITAGTVLCLPSFGGEKYSEKDTLNNDLDAVQPAFKKSRDALPAMPGDNISADPRLRSY